MSLSLISSRVNLGRKENKMTRIGLWWTLKGEKKVKKIIGRTSRIILYWIVGLGCIAFIVGLINHFEWTAIFWFGGAFLLVFLIYSAITWTD